MTELSIENCHVYRGDQHVLRGLSLAVAAGNCLQITGENGAGKTTLLRVLCGLLPAESLQLSWQGQSCSPQSPEYHQQLSYLSHAAPLKADLTGWENLKFLLGLRGVWQSTTVSAWLDRLGAKTFADRPVRSLSAGQRRRLALVGLAASQTSLWLLDEPTTNLDRAGTGVVTDLIDEHLQRGGLAVVATHVDLGLSAERLKSLHLRAGRAREEQPW
jgi:heme exporter protein A